MKVLVIGQGGREHCLAWKLSHSPLVEKIYCAPGNGGTALIAQNVDISPMDIDALLKFALGEKIDLTIVGPEMPLVSGIVDKFEEKGLKIFGPKKELALLEGSKVFAKQLMKKYGIPTPDFEVFEDSNQAKEYIKTKQMPVVVKADGLAEGKGVLICGTLNETMGAIDLIMEEKIFGKAGNKIVIEDYIEGQEASILIFTDGESFMPLVSSQDHKRILDGDEGANTGGMGAYAPALLVSKDILDKIMNKICTPLINGLKSEGKIYKGMLYIGLMVKNGEPYVLEFNVRFGDPETQAILPKLKNDFADVILKVVDNKLEGLSLEWDERFCLCVVLASGGYPGSYERGKEITGLEKVDGLRDLLVFHAGTKQEIAGGAQAQKPKFLTNGGRVLNIVGMGKDAGEARQMVYTAIESISFDKMCYRKDIGSKALQ